MCYYYKPQYFLSNDSYSTNNVFYSESGCKLSLEAGLIFHHCIKKERLFEIPIVLRKKCYSNPIS